jgi:outer membrane protein insertion porin family
MDGVRRTIAINYRDTTQFTSASSDFSTTSAGATIDYGYPISEFQTISLGLSYQHAELLASSSSTQQAQDWVRNNGDFFEEQTSAGFSFIGSEFDAFELIAGWTFDSRNRSLFANRGTRQQFVLSMAVPGSDVEYYSARYNFTKYIPLWKSKWVVRLNAELGLSQALGDTTAAPPYKQYYGGGLVASQVELILPLPDKWASQARASLFFDAGNVFNTGEVSFTDKLGSPIEYKPEFDELRTSVGIGVQWLAPLGLFRFSYAYPLNEYRGNDRYYGDELERFQFSIGQAF